MSNVTKYLPRNITKVFAAALCALAPLLAGIAAASDLPIEPIGPSSRKTGMIISEIMYHPRHSNSLEFVEVYNADLIEQDLSDFRIAGDIEYRFPAGTKLPVGQYLVVARDPALMRAAYGITGIHGPWLPGTDGATNSLPDDVGRVRLRNKAGAVLLEVNYEGIAPWPLAADGTGHSMVLARASYGEDDPRAWAHSARIGGSPGAVEPAAADPLSSIVINEFVANSDLIEDFVELYNRSTNTVDLSGAWLSDDRDTNKFRILEGTTIGPRGFATFNQTTLGFALSSGGERIYLVNPSQTRVIDMHAFEAQAVNVSSGRYPDGSPSFHELATRTAGTANSALLVRDVVINELMFNPISGDDADEFVELYNRGATAVNLSGWRFTAGINYTFPSNTTLPAGGYLVVANNLYRLLTNYSHLSAANTLGNYSGQLANGGERVALSMPEVVPGTNGGTTVNYIVVDEVTYNDGGRWSLWADGGGSSLELIDPNSDNRWMPNWADSDETRKSEWISINHREITDHAYPRGGAGADLNEVQLLLLGAGEALVDDVGVHVEGGTSGPNLVANSSFDGGLGGWTIQGNHVNSTLEPAGVNNPTPSLRLRASSGGDNGANRVEHNLTTTLVPNGNASVRARARWLRGHPDLLLRLHGGGLETVSRLPLPSNLGSPGQANSRRVGNAGPSITDVSHSPAIPAGGQPVVVTARVRDVNGIGLVQLRYRQDPSATLTSATMRDDGTSGDALAGDGIYSATITAGAGTLIAFRVQATDLAGIPATTTFPPDAPSRECLVRFGDTATTGNLGVFRLWMTAANMNTWIARERLSNEALDSTFIYNNHRVVYFAGARYRGSPFIRPGYNTPTGNACAYVWVVPEDDLVLGEDELNLDSLEPQGRDATALREITSFTILEQLGYPSSFQRFTHVVINGINNASRNIPIYTDSQQPNSSYIASWFPEDSEGEIFKVDDWFEFTDAVTMEQNKCASLQNFVTTGGAKKKARYRWNWEKKSNRGLNDDYSSLFRKVDALNAPDATYVSQVESIIETEEYLTALAFRHVIGDWDGYGYRRGKNQFTYRVPGGKFYMLMWDLDFSLGCNSGDPPTHDLFQVSQETDTGQNHMPEIARLYGHPHFRRIYLRGLERMARGPLQDTNFMPILDARYRALQANGVVATSPYVGSGQQGISIPAWIQQRRANILTQIPAAAFARTSPAQVSTTSNLVAITGTAPIAVKTIRVNGVEYMPTWTGPTAWTIRLPVTESSNRLEIVGYDLNGAVMTTTQAVTVLYSGPRPESREAIVFNEIMYNPLTPNASFVEILNTAPFAFDLSGWRVNGIDFTFAEGTVLNPGQIIVLAQDRVAFATAYGTAVPVFGEFGGNLDPDGETLSLLQPDGTDAGVAVDRVRYERTAPWASGATTDGRSLQLMDGSQDNARVSNWSDGQGWQFFTYTANLPVGTNQLRIFLNGVGDIYVDDLALVAGTAPGVGQNLIRNGDFEGPLLTNDSGPFEFSQPSLSNTVISMSVQHSGNGSLHLVHKVPGPTSFLLQNGVAIPTAGPHTLSFWYIPITSNFTFTVYVTSAFRPPANVRAVLATPGVANSVVAPVQPYPTLWLNEVQPNNISGIQDASGAREPWLELYNGGTNAVNLSGLFLTDSYSSNFTQWAFPNGSSIAPGQFKVIFADGQAGQTTASEWHTSFRLPPGSGTLALTRIVNNEPQIVDYLTYENITANLSYGDYGDGQPFYRTTLYTVTPGSTNIARPGAVYINEWLAQNQNGLVDPADNDHDDWFELYNPNDYAVDLGGYYLTDNLTNETQFRIPDGYVVPAGGYLLVWADGETGQNDPSRADLHAGFALSRDGEAIGLFTSDGALVDSITFTNQTIDISEGRYPDGAVDRYSMTNTTPREPNLITGIGNNAAPVIAAITPKYVTVGQTVSFTATATDPEGHSVTWNLVAPPAGATIHSTSGLFAWTPNITQAPSTNNVTIRALDNGTPPMTATRSVTIYVVSPPDVIFSKNGSQVTLTFGSVAGQRYQVEYNDLLRETNWQSLGVPVTATGSSVTINDNVGAQPQRFYRIRLLD
jgi:hypothetical protein